MLPRPGWSDDHVIPSMTSGATDEPSTASEATEEPDTMSGVADDVTTSYTGKITDSLTTGYDATTISNATNPSSHPRLHPLLPLRQHWQ